MRATILPELGAGLARLDAILDGRTVPLLRPVPQAPDGPLLLGLNVLAPFSNRISSGVPFEGVVHALEHNLAGERYPIHGDAWQRVWRVVEAGDTVATLALDGSFGPYRYEAALHYAIHDATLEMALELTNRGERLPFGGGFHPWFRREADTTLAFAADGVWLERADHLPDRPLAISQSPDFDFAKPRGLPPQWINNAFTGWDGTARLAHPSLGIATVLTAEPPLDVLIVHARTPAEPFVCLEPVSHPVDAHNLAGQPGLVALDPGEVLRLRATIEWRLA